MKRLRATVHGRVQGVSFRYYTARRAQELGLTGWVRNRSDGTVETLAEGGEEQLQQFLEFLNMGSPAARVNHVASSWHAATGQFDQFEITRE